MTVTGPIFTNILTYRNAVLTKRFVVCSL